MSLQTYTSKDEATHRKTRYVASTVDNPIFSFPATCPVVDKYILRDIFCVCVDFCILWHRIGLPLPPLKHKPVWTINTWLEDFNWPRAYESYTFGINHRNILKCIRFTDLFTTCISSLLPPSPVLKNQQP